jgi:hypothetical protein
MFEILREDAVARVWCSPTQDNQIILAPQRTTKKGGDIVTAVVTSRRIMLPENKKYYHLYCIGAHHPTTLGLLPMTPQWAGGWIKITEAVNSLPLFVDVYTDSGVKIPLDMVYYQRTLNRAMVFCVEIGKGLDVDLDVENLYFRFYTNAFYDTVESDPLPQNTRVISKRLLNMSELLGVQSVETTWKTWGGSTFSYVNGNLVKGISPITAKVGDRVEVVVDTSVKKIVDFKLSELLAFTSVRDQKQKYLLHYPAEDELINYVDDVDVYLVAEVGTQTIGRLIHRNLASTLRMVTHRDYSLLVDNVLNTLEDLSTFVESNGGEVGNVYVRLYIRNSGLFKTLPYESSRIKELYKLSDEKIVQAMVGADAVLPIWTAPALENSPFVKLLDVPYNEISIELIEAAYGYNALTKVLGDTPQTGMNIQLGPEAFELPAGLQVESTIYEYNSEGVLLGWHQHLGAQLYIARSSDCRYIEGVVGLGSEAPTVTYGQTDIGIPAGYSFRVYMAYGDAASQITPWKDVTDSGDYVVENGILKWQGDDEDYVLMVRFDRGFLAYDLEITPVAGTIYFTLAEFSGGLHRTLAVPPGDLDIWLNGRKLINGLNMAVSFPHVYVFDKDYLVQPAGSTPQKLTIRATGFAESTAEGFVTDKDDDYGFIEHGVLSNNNRFDIRDDRVMTVTVEGCLKLRSDIIFSEQHSGVSVSNALNGQFYQVKDRLVPLRWLTKSQAEALRDQSRSVDQAVSDYMSLQLPQPPRDAPSAIQKRHRLFSPFFSHLINDLQSGQFDRSVFSKVLSDTDVLTICKPYEALLENDPLHERFGIDYRMVLIHPHQLDNTILLDVESYAFLKHVVKLYGKSLISINGHLNINAIGGN